MYTLAVEIHGLRQLERLQPELVSDLNRRLVSAIEVQGGAFAGRLCELWLFRFERARADDRQGILDALQHAMTILAAREPELAGWLVFVDYLEGPSAAVAGQIHDQLLPVYQDNVAILGRSGHELLGHLFDLEPVDGVVGLSKLGALLGSHASEVGSAIDIARSDASVDAIVGALDPDALAGGLLQVVLDDRLALRVNTRSALELITGTASVRWLEAEADDEWDLAPLVTAFSPLAVHETGFWLRGAEQRAWEERSPLVHALTGSLPGPVLPDALEVDLGIAFESYLVAYLRRAADAVVPPVLLCHNIDLWPRAAVDSVVRTLTRLPVSEHAPGLMVIATATRGTTPGLDQVTRQTVRLPRPSIASLRERTRAEVNWERVVRLTHGRAASVVHYLVAADHWDAVPESSLEDVSESDLAWRVVRRQDSDVQELLLAAHYAGRYLAREQFAELALALGSDRVRVPAALGRMRLLGLVDDRDRIVPLHPDHVARLEATLGRSAERVAERVGEHLHELAQRGGIEPSEALVTFLARFDEGRYVPALFHRLLTRTMSRRRLAEAQRLLYDNAPPRGVRGGARGCLQLVTAANKLRLALLQGNLQVAERTRTQSDRILDADACDFAAGDLAVAKARLTFLQQPSGETTALLKRAVMIYQDLDDQSGLARANLDFGLVLLAQEDLLGAREYFTIGARAAANAGDVFESVRAAQLMLVSNYVHGNLSRALEQAEALDEQAATAGMREVQLFVEHARGRIQFELGRYEEAADTFARGRSRARLYAMSRPGAVMERWLARALIHDGRVRRGTAILNDQRVHAESLFFLAEGLLRRGEHAEAIAALTQGLEFGGSEAFSPESTPWSTGFAALEDRAIGVVAGSRVLEHQMIALRGFVLAESGRVADGIEEMHRLTRELRLSEIDPYNRIYFYLYSRILPESGELNVEDGTTVLGKAVRFIQQRTSRMDDYAHKTDFLRRNYWNARLMEHAQAHNLV